MQKDKIIKLGRFTEIAVSTYGRKELGEIGVSRAFLLDTKTHARKERFSYKPAKQLWPVAVGRTSRTVDHEGNVTSKPETWEPHWLTSAQILGLWVDHLDAKAVREAREQAASNAREAADTRRKNWARRTAQRVRNLGIKLGGYGYGVGMNLDAYSGKLTFTVDSASLERLLELAELGLKGRAGRGLMADIDKTPDEVMADLNQVLADITEVNQDLIGLRQLRRKYEDQLNEHMRETGRLAHINSDGSYGWDDEGWH